MAIERMKSLWLFARRGTARRLVERLAAMGLVHVADCGPVEPERLEAIGIERVFPEAVDIQRRVQLLRETHQVLSRFHRTGRTILENFITTPLEVRQADVQEALRGLDPERLHALVKEAEGELNRLGGLLQKAQDGLRALQPLEGVDAMLPGREDQRRVAAYLGVMLRSRFEALQKDERLPASCILSMVATRKRLCVVEAACPASSGAELAMLLRDYDCEIVEPEGRTVSIADYIAHRRSDVERLRRETGEARRRLVELARETHRRVEIALGYWEERARIVAAAERAVESRRLTVVKAFVRERDLPAFRSLMARELADVAYEVHDPAPDEVVPVSLRNARIFAPAETLVSMFGLPDYFSLDPSPVIFFSFLIFFGFCFGDVIYGILLIILGALLARKYRDYTGLRHFFLLLAFGGVPTVIVGALTGSWAGDLPRHLGENNALQRLSDALKVADPIRNAVHLLVLALAMGMFNQWLGIVMGMVRNVRKGDIRAAIYDGLFWLLLLPGLVVILSGLFVSVPVGLRRAALGAVAVGALGLVMTQGRHEKTLLGRALIGLVSLYGVVGTYGVTAFVGDTLSYCRLLALGLTTGIVGVCFNMIAMLSRRLPVIGIVLCLLVLTGGHLLNFFLSILGGFVHSARLTFVEFFGRFYQGGAPRFSPLGRWSGSIRVIDHDLVWTD